MDFGRKLVIMTLVLETGIFFPAAMSEARRAYDPKVETKVTLPRDERASDKREKANIRERIQAILQGPAEEEPAAVMESPLAPVDLSNEAILGQAMATQQQCVNYLLSINPMPAISVSPQELVSYYYEEGAREGIRPDVAFAQALKETGYFRYGGTVTPDQNN